MSDILQLIESWGVWWNKSSDADLDNDNLVTLSDLLLLIEVRLKAMILGILLSLNYVRLLISNKG